MSFARNYALRGFFGGKGESSDGGSGVTIRNQNKTFTENGSYRADSGYTGLGTVTVNVPEREPVLEPLTVTENGTYNPGSGVDGFSPVTVNVASVGSGGYTIEDIAKTSAIGGDIEIENIVLRPFAFAYLDTIGKVTIGENVTQSIALYAGGHAFMGSSVTEVIGNLSMKGHDGPVLYAQFKDCKQLKKVTAPNWQPCCENFDGCTALESIDVLSLGYDKTYANCSNLKIIILRSSTLQALSSNNTYWAFCLNMTPFDPDNANATGGYVLVPSALAPEYQIATNWSILHDANLCTFLPLEEYTLDGTTTGEINWDKLNAVVYPA